MIRAFASKTFPEGEWHTWTDEEIAAYEARWPIGSAARTAFAVLPFTGQRMADVSRMAWSDVGEGAIRVVQGKTKLSVPLHPDLAEVLAAWPRAHERILTTAFGKPFTPKGFGNWMADKIGQSRVPDRCVTHGLRKAAARRLAEAGCSANEIAAITGHATLTEISRYTKAAEQSARTG
jgi:integrase